MIGRTVAQYCGPPPRSIRKSLANRRSRYRFRTVCSPAIMSRQIARTQAHRRRGARPAAANKRTVAMAPSASAPTACADAGETDSVTYRVTFQAVKARRRFRYALEDRDCGTHQARLTIVANETTGSRKRLLVAVHKCLTTQN